MQDLRIKSLNVVFKMQATSEIVSYFSFHLHELHVKTAKVSCILDGTLYLLISGTNSIFY